MTLDPQSLRIDGVYEQRQPGNFMLRVKVPAGILSSEQALKVAEIADRFAGGAVHLTTRGSIELHWLQPDTLAEAWRMLAAVGLTTRGACGGAVRGVVCAAPDEAGYAIVQALAQRLLHHFTRNPRFEGLPKKFKIGVFAGYGDGRHLIQDLALVLRGGEGEARYDVWTAGGLGREPSPAFLLEEGVAAERIIPLAEAVVAVYRDNTPKGKRLKHLVREVGRDGFERLVRELEEQPRSLGAAIGLAAALTPAPSNVAPERVEAVIFAGELKTVELTALADIARRYADGFMVLTGGQNVLFFLSGRRQRDNAVSALAAAGFDGGSRMQRVNFRVCPGIHECRMGLAPTRDVAAAVIDSMGAGGEHLAWSISGCPNSCSQPQLADVGIVTVKSVKGDDGERHPLFDLYRRSGNDGFGAAVSQGLALEELLRTVQALG
ncbi:MAG: nitrite/sulfite reductase [Desulfuromonadales bacterium]|nr:MAG: nitrite/sulfite reductase [Desulfuromonadales bacterium]